MSSLFDIDDQVRRLRQVVSFLRDAMALSGAELRKMPGSSAHEEWTKLHASLRELASNAELWSAATGSKPDEGDDLPRTLAAETAARFRSGATIH